MVMVEENCNSYIYYIDIFFFLLRLLFFSFFRIIDTVDGFITNQHLFLDITYTRSSCGSFYVITFVWMK